MTVTSSARQVMAACRTPWSYRRKRVLPFVPMLVLSVGALVGCSTAVSPGTALPFARLRPDPTALEANSGYEQLTTLIVRDRTAWETTWAQIFRNITPVPPLPEVNFSSEMIVGIALGTKANADVVVTGVSKDGDMIIIDATETISRQSSGCAIAPVVSSAVDLARVPSWPGTVTAHLTERQASCS